MFPHEEPPLTLEAAPRIAAAIQEIPLVRALNENLQDVREHEEEVGLFAGRLAIQLGLDEVIIMSAQEGGFIHDNGKSKCLALSQKPDILDEAETATMHRHPEDGFWGIVKAQFEISEDQEASVDTSSGYDWKQALSLETALGITAEEAERVATYSLYVALSHHRWASSDVSSRPYPQIDKMHDILVQAGLSGELITNPEANKASNLVALVDLVHGVTVRRPYHEARFKREGREPDLTPEGVADLAFHDKQILPSLIEAGLTRAMLAETAALIAVRAEARDEKINLVPGSAQHYLEQQAARQVDRPPLAMAA